MTRQGSFCHHHDGWHRIVAHIAGSTDSNAYGGAARRSTGFSSTGSPSSGDMLTCSTMLVRVRRICPLPRDNADGMTSN